MLLFCVKKCGFFQNPHGIHANRF